MKNKELKRIALRLAELSVEAGSVVEARVRLVLVELEKAFPPMTLRPILKFYYAEVARELRFSEARIEFAGTLPQGTENKLAMYFSKIYKRTISAVPVKNDALLAGMRVQVADDVYDASIAGTLEKLRAELVA